MFRTLSDSHLKPENWVLPLSMNWKRRENLLHEFRGRMYEFDAAMATSNVLIRDIDSVWGMLGTRSRGLSPSQPEDRPHRLFRPRGVVRFRQPPRRSQSDRISQTRPILTRTSMRSPPMLGDLKSTGLTMSHVLSEQNHQLDKLAYSVDRTNSASRVAQAVVRLT